MEIIAIGTDVLLIDKPAVINAVQIEGIPTIIQYKVAYWTNGVRNEAWVSDHEVKLHPDGNSEIIRIGFNGANNVHSR